MYRLRIKNALKFIPVLVLLTGLLGGCGTDYLTQSVHDIKSAVTGAPIEAEQTETLDLGGTVSEIRSDVEETVDETLTDYSVAEPEIPDTSSADCYVYNTLSAEERVVYDQVYDALTGLKADVPVSTTDKDELRKMYECVLADHGDIFWTSGYVYHIYSRGDEIIGLTFSPNFTMDEQERDATRQAIESVASEWVEGLSPDASDYEKSEYIYRTLITNVAYDETAEDNQNIKSVFLNRATVCQGYANAVCYLAHRMGLQAAVVTGYANGELHAWNLIRLDGEYYYMDVTWGNSSYMDMEDSAQRFVNYAYLNVTGEELASTHTSYVDYPLPDCRATMDNYYRQEGRYFDTPDMDAIGRVFGEAYSLGQETSSVKIAGADDYREVVRYFIDEEHIADHCPGITRISYLQSDNMGVFTLVF